MKVEAAHFAIISPNCCFFCDIRLEASNLVATKKQNMFSVRESVKSAVQLQNTENGCSQKDNAEISLPQQKTGRNVAFIKIKYKIYVTHCKLAGNLFPVQYRWKQRNSTVHKPKHVFPAIQLKEAYLNTHTQKNALLV